MLRSIDPEAIYRPVGSKRTAKTSPEWPASSMTGDWRVPACPLYGCCQPRCTFSWCMTPRMLIGTYRSYEGAILPCCARYRNGGAVKVRVRLCALDELVRAEGVVRGAFGLRHCGQFALVCGAEPESGSEMGEVVRGGIQGCLPMLWCRLNFGEVRKFNSSPRACQGSTMDMRACACAGALPRQSTCALALALAPLSLLPALSLPVSLPSLDHARLPHIRCLYHPPPSTRHTARETTTTYGHDHDHDHGHGRNQSAET